MLPRSLSKLATLLVLFGVSHAAAGPISLLLGTTDKHGISSNTSTTYLLVSGINQTSLLGTSTTEADATEGLPPGTLSKLACVVDQMPGGAASLAMTVRVGAADTALTCTIATTATRCSDHIHTATVAADPRVAIKIVPTSTPVVSQLSCRLFFNRT